MIKNTFLFAPNFFSDPGSFYNFALVNKHKTNTIMEDKITEKVYCYDHPSAYRQDNSALWAAVMSKNESPAELMSLMNNNNMMNNPFFYLIFLMLFRNGFWGNGQEAAVNANTDFNRLSAQMADNQNTTLLMDAVKGNSNAISQLASSLNCDFRTMQNCCCSIQSAIEQVAGQVGFSAERVINAVNLGNQNITSKLSECCCATQKAILEQGYQNQLATERQTNVLGSQMAANHASTQLQDCQNHGSLMSRMDQLSSVIQTGFSQVGYAAQANTQAIINAQNANTQRILDQMCQNTTQDLRDKLAQMSQDAQTSKILAKLNGGCGCNCGC